MGAAPVRVGFDFPARAPLAVGFDFPASVARQRVIGRGKSYLTRYFLVAFLGVGSVDAQNLLAQGACRDGAPHGAWQIATPDGKLRALGAFNRGKRTGSFIFWNASGVRVAHVPFEEDEKNGTLALWYPTLARGPDAQQRLEAGYSNGKPNGANRSWHPDGRLRSEYAFEDGRIASAKAWDARGRALPQAQARAQAERDIADHESHYATLDALVRKHLPACGGIAPPKPR